MLHYNMKHYLAMLFIVLCSGCREFRMSAGDPAGPSNVVVFGQSIAVALPTNSIKDAVWSRLGKGLNIENVAHGNSSLHQQLTTYLMQTLQTVKTMQPVVILAAIGDTDSALGTSEETFFQEYLEMMRQVHRVSPNTVWYIARAAATDGSGSMAVLKAEERLVSQGYARRGPDINEIRELSGTTDPGGKELNALGQELHAKAWTDILLRDLPWSR